MGVATVGREFSNAEVIVLLRFFMANDFLLEGYKSSSEISNLRFQIRQELAAQRLRA